MSKPDMKRFYRDVTIGAAQDGREADGPFLVLLDGRQVKSPMGRVLAVPSQQLAEAMATEWVAQSEKILPATMPMTQLSFTAIDRIAPEREEVAQRISRYGETDLLCYRAEAPSDLVQRQTEEWDPLLAWADAQYGAVLTVTSGIIPVPQPEDALAALANAVDAFDPYRLTALAAVVQAAGSLVIGLSLVAGRLNAAQAVAVSQLDDAYQSEKWGQDKEALDRLKALQTEITQAEHFLGLL
ncbi:MAG: ATP12 family protein [Rhodospirillales bacterium]